MPLNEYKFFEKTGKGNKQTNLLTNNKSAFELLVGDETVALPPLFPRTKSKKYPDTAKKSFDKWFDKSFDEDSYKRDEKYDHLYDLWKKSGGPYVKPFLSRSTPSYKLENIPFSRSNLLDLLGMSKTAREVYPDTINVREGRYDDFLEELSHGFQYKDLGPIKAAQSLNKLLAERKKYGKGVYFEKGTEEYKAHREIGDPMIDEYESKFPRTKRWKDYKEPPIVKQMKILEEHLGRKLIAKEIWEIQESMKNK